MEKIPTPNITATEKAKAILEIVMYNLVIDKTMQMTDIQELYENLSDQDSSTLVERAAEAKLALQNLPPEQRVALNLRAAREVFGTQPFLNTDI